jgi:RHS repeat-associated protein
MNHVACIDMDRGGTITTAYTYTSNGVNCNSVYAPGTGVRQTRTFVYNNAGLLISATNPKNGMVTYTYSSDNTLHYKQDGKGQVTAYTYDSLKRVTEIQKFPTGLSHAEDVCGRVFYTWGTDPTNYNYGRLTEVQSYAPSYGSTTGCGWANYAYNYAENGIGIQDQYQKYFSYAASGAVLDEDFALVRTFPDQSTASVGFWVPYSYDNAGRLSTLSYQMYSPTNPSFQPTLTMTYDGMGRPSALTDKADNVNWVSNVQYDFAGRMTSLTYLTGNGSGSQTSVSETTTYNSATGQLASLSWSGAGVSGGIQYAYSSTMNNGQITQVTDTVSGETISYQYDVLKRLISAGSTPISGSTPTPWTQGFQYDGFGNLTAKVLNGTTTSIPVNAATNQLGNAYYDLNGNMTSGAGATLTYDESNRMIAAQEVSGGKEYYGYDASNKRVYRVTASGQEQITLYGLQGEKLGVYAIQAGSCTWGSYYGTGFPCVTGLTALSSNVWFAGKLIMDSGSAVAQDRLGTNRVSGARFYPYGDEITSTTNDREKFATYTRDSYTGLDYADQRFYASTYDRFNTPDPYQASGGPSDPGSWNRYSYVGGDPVNRLDPGGTCWITTYSSDANGNFSVNCFDYLEMALTPSINPAALAQCLAVNTCSANLKTMQGGGGAPSGPLSVFQLYNVAAELAPQVNGTTLTNCQALGEYASAAAWDNGSASQFVKDFSNLVPSANFNEVQLYNGGNNGFLSQFQNTVNDNAYGNGDQAHHFAAFLQLGYEFDVGTASAASFVLEWYEAWRNGGPVNQGDIALGIYAAELGAGLRSGTVSIAGALQQIRGTCTQ